MSLVLLVKRMNNLIEKNLCNKSIFNQSSFQEFIQTVLTGCVVESLHTFVIFNKVSGQSMALALSRSS